MQVLRGVDVIKIHEQVIPYALAPENPMGTIYRSVMYYLTACIVSLVILTLFPEIVMFVPSLVK